METTSRRLKAEVQLEALQDKQAAKKQGGGSSVKSRLREQIAAREDSAALPSHSKARRGQLSKPEKDAATIAFEARESEREAAIAAKKVELAAAELIKAEEREADASASKGRRRKQSVASSKPASPLKRASLAPSPMADSPPKPASTSGPAAPSLVCLDAGGAASVAPSDSSLPQDIARSSRVRPPLKPSPSPPSPSPSQDWRCGADQTSQTAEVVGKVKQPHAESSRTSSAWINEKEDL